MKEVIIIILLLCIVNTFLLLKHMFDMKKCGNSEGFFDTGDRTSTRVGPYNGVTSCSGIGARNVHDSNRPIGDDSFIFNGPKSNSK